MKPHIKVIQRNGVDIFVTSSMVMKEENRLHEFMWSDNDKWSEDVINKIDRTTLDTYQTFATNALSSPSNATGCIGGYDPRQTSGYY